MIQVSICEYFATRIFIKTHRLSPALSPASFDLQRLKVDTIFHPRETKAESASGPAECDGLIDVSIGHSEGGGVIGVAKQWVVSMVWGEYEDDEGGGIRRRRRGRELRMRGVRGW